VARPRPEKQQEETKPARAQPATRTVLPMQLRIGDRFSDETGAWEVVGRPYTTAGGKIVHARVQRVGQPASVEVRSWDAFKRISVRGATTEEGS